MKILQILILLALPTISFSAYHYEVDRNGDRVVSPDEFKVFLETIHKKPLSFFDKNNDGLLSPKELEIASSIISKSILQTEVLVDFYTEDHKNEDGSVGLSIKKFKKIYDFEKVEDILKIVYQEYTPPKKKKLFIRGKKEELTDFSGETPFKKASTAEFSFINDRNDSNTIWSVKGIIMMPFEIGSDNDLIFVPSLEINRLSNDNNEEKEIDTFIVRTSLGWLGETGNTDWYFSLSPTHTTDSNFDSNIKSIDLSISPINTRFGFGGSKTIAENILIRNSLSLNFDYGKIFDNGGNQSLTEDEEFLRIGPNMKLEAWLLNNDNFKAEFDYGYFKRISGDLRSKKLFKAVFEYKLNPKGNYVLKISYTNGDTSNKLEDEDTLSFGIGVKF
jgi:hypothetical protein